MCKWAEGFLGEKIYLEKKNKTKNKNQNSGQHGYSGYDVQSTNVGAANKQIKKLRGTQNSKIKDKINLKTIFTKTKAKKVQGVPNMLKMRYVGHITRESKRLDIS